MTDLLIVGGGAAGITALTDRGGQARAGCA